MRHVRSLAIAVLVYGGCLAVTAVTPAEADAQVVYSYYSPPYWGYSANYGVYPAGYAVPNYYSGYGNYPVGWYNWGGNTTPSGYPQWYVNYVRWNSPSNRYVYPYYNPYRGYPGRRW